MAVLRDNSKQSGFTLLEMSIVLVIISLIVGGIVIGSTMIRQSQIEGVIKEVTQFRQALQDFHDKYNAYPGDFANAEALWGSDTTGGGTCPAIATTALPHVTTCNGNGDGWIGGNGMNTVKDYETFRAWQQLADAGLIGGQYTGVTGAGSSYNALPGVNVPTSQIPGAGYTLFYEAPTFDPADNFPSLYGNILQFGLPASNSYTTAAVMTPEETFTMDTKIDDGLPGYGNMLVEHNYTNCVTTSDPTTAQYNLNYTSRACSIVFLTGAQ